jgi:uncharacterized membrane protein
MIRLSKAILIALIVFILGYLTSCFAEATFDITKFSPVTRVIVAIIGGISSIVMFFYEYFNEENKKTR